MKFLIVLRNKVERGGMWSHACPTGKDYFKQFLYSMYRAGCKPVPQIQNTQQYLKTNRNRNGPLAPPHRRLGGHNQAEIKSHPLGRLGGVKVSTPTISMDEKEVTAQSTAHRGSRRQREWWGRDRLLGGLLKCLKL